LYFPLAGVEVPLWHLLWLGFWTGYIMAIVGEATGILTLPYAMTVLQFDNVHISPTDLVTTFINPIGALLGYRREKQWNPDLALWLCAGAAVGANIGPFIRTIYLPNPTPFKATVGLGLIFMGAYLLYQVTPGYVRKMEKQLRLKEKFDARARQMVEEGKLPSGLPEDLQIQTLEKSGTRLRIGFWGEEWTFNLTHLFLIGFGVGIVASTFGVGGGFLLVPILVTLYKLPMYVLVAATIPFVMVLSTVGLFAYSVTVPYLTGIYAAPEWAWGFFVAVTAIFGSWCASKTQKYVPERYLKPILGGLTVIVGVIYVVNYFVGLPFHV
jgi:hypothetical protein